MIPDCDNDSCSFYDNFVSYATICIHDDLLSILFVISINSDISLLNLFKNYFALLMKNTNQLDLT